MRPASPWRAAPREAPARVDAGGAVDDPSPDAEASARSANLARCDHGLNRHGEAVEGFRSYVGRDRGAPLDDDRAPEDTARALARAGAYRRPCANEARTLAGSRKSSSPARPGLRREMLPAARAAVAADRMSLQAPCRRGHSRAAPRGGACGRRGATRAYEAHWKQIGGLTSAKGRRSTAEGYDRGASRLRPRYGGLVGGKRYDILGKNLEREGTDECSICLGPFRSPVSLGCGHRFCADCPRAAGRRASSTCALCRRELSPDHDAVRKAMRDARAKARWGPTTLQPTRDPHEQSALHAVAEDARARQTARRPRDGRRG